MKKIDFEALDEARVQPRKNHPKGHTVAEMCTEIGVTVDAYYKLKKRKHEPRLRTVAAFRRYIQNAKRIGSSGG